MKSSYSLVLLSAGTENTSLGEGADPGAVHRAPAHPRGQSGPKNLPGGTRLRPAYFSWRWLHLRQKRPREDPTRRFAVEGRTPVDVIWTTWTEALYDAVQRVCVILAENYFMYYVSACEVWWICLYTRSRLMSHLYRLHKLDDYITVKAA